MSSFHERYLAHQTRIKKEKAKAAKCKLSHNQYVLLKALEDGEEHSFREIVMATGVYSNLPAELRERHLGSLGSNGLVREGTFFDEETNKRVFTFQITKVGKKTLALAEKGS